MNEPDVAVYVSCDKGHEIVRFSMDRTTGALTRRDATKMPVAPEPKADPLAPPLLNTSGAPLAVSPDSGFLYASIRKPPFRVASYRVDPETGALGQLGEALIPDSTPFILPDRTGRFLFGACYFGSLVWVGKIEPDGRLAASPVQIVDQIKTPHSILLHPNNRFAYVAATGHNEILSFHFDDATGQLAYQGPLGAAASSDATPRHLALHPTSDFLYCMNETTGIIDGFRVDPASGALTHLQSVDGRSPEQMAAPGLGSDLHISPDGRFLYGSERAHDTISAYAIDVASGKLSHIQTVPAGKFPRSFGIDPAGRFLIAAGQGTGYLTVFTIDGASGQLTDPVPHKAEDGPIWVEIVELARRYANDLKARS